MTLGAAVLAVFLVKLPLYMRTLPSHGVSPYWHYLPGFLDYNVAYSSVFRNLLISYGIIGATAYQQGHLDASVLWTSINPAPGSLAGWYEVAPALRLNQ